MARAKKRVPLLLVFAGEGKALKPLHPIELDPVSLEPLRYGRRRLVPAVKIEAPDLADRALTVDQIWLQKGKHLAKLDLPTPVSVGGAAAAEFPAGTLIFGPEG